jgi:hypothetical protein
MQVPLRASVASDPPGEVLRWRFDEDGQIEVSLRDQTGEKHVALFVEVDVLRVESLVYDSARERSSLRKVKARTTAALPWLRPPAGADGDDPEVMRVASPMRSSAGDLRTLVAKIEELFPAAVRVEPGGSHDAAEALKKGSASPLGRARIAAAVALSFGVPSRIIGTLPVPGSGELDWSVEMHVESVGWLRHDLSGRRTPSFPAPEAADVALVLIDADTPIRGDSSPRAVTARGGITAGARDGSPILTSRELAARRCSRALASQLFGVLGPEFDAARARQHEAAAPLDLLAGERVRKDAKLLEWLELLAGPIGERRG